MRIKEAWELVIAARPAEEATRTTDAQPAIRGFIETANELDIILKEAEGRRNRNETPKDLWLWVLITLLFESRTIDPIDFLYDARKGADAEATVRHATNEILSSEIENLRVKRLAVSFLRIVVKPRFWPFFWSFQLVEKNKATYTAVAAKQVQAERIDASIQNIVSDFQQVSRYFFPPQVRARYSSDFFVHLVNGRAQQDWLLRDWRSAG